MSPKKDTEEMNANTQACKGAPEFAQKSSLYQEFLAERDEILRHKWLESEKLGRDIGFERALLDWIRKHRENWRKSRKGVEKTKH
ncbi:hypothetical protein [Coraliomargarita parva]|uniref:hypothetical protein n=1 Tax=Coraliomargarita parva TaxID=3014050 RepID=UPI0022B4931B|nr:hypothetical protein [Coraliomargarita parva]